MSLLIIIYKRNLPQLCTLYIWLFVCLLCKDQILFCSTNVFNWLQPLNRHGCHYNSHWEEESAAVELSRWGGENITILNINTLVRNHYRGNSLQLKNIPICTCMFGQCYSGYLDIYNLRLRFYFNDCYLSKHLNPNNWCKWQNVL